MFDKQISPAEYTYLSNARANLVRQLMVDAMHD
jgi:hypothetical protein